MPKFKTEARAFLGVTGYYQNHIRDYAQLAAPWSDVTGKTDKEAEKTPLRVTKEMRQSFERLKDALVTAPVLGFPHFSGPKAGRFTLDTDFSKDQIGAVLSQDQNGQEVVIAYASKKLSKSQRNWPSTKGELWAGLFFMTKLEYYLRYGPQFRWRTDNQALKYYQTLNCPTAVISRWLNSLADFDFIVEHRAGTKHANADGLSRSGYAEEISEEDLPEQDDSRRCSAIEPAIPPRLRLLQHTRDELRVLQEEDEDLKKVRQWIKDETAPQGNELRALSRVGKIYAGMIENHVLSIADDGIIRYAVPNQFDKDCVRQLICLPQLLWQDTLEAAHISGGHMAVEITLKRLREVVFFPGMRLEVEGHVATCLRCQKKKGKQPDQRHTLASPTNGYPFQRIHIDFIGPFPPGSITGSKWILTCRDAFSKWLEAIPMTSTSSKAVAQVLEKEIFARYGIPESIHSDMALQFESNLYKGLGELLGYNVSHTGGYNPKSNGIVERVHRDLGNMFRALLDDSPDEWEDILPQALFAVRTNVCEATGLAPYQALFGREASQPLDLIFGNPNGYEQDPNDRREHHHYLRGLRERIDKAQVFIRKHLQDAVRRQRRHYQKEKQFFLPGTKVWLYSPSKRHVGAQKLATVWTGPWTVCNRPVNDCMVRIIPHPSWRIKGSKVVSIDRLKLYKSREDINREPVAGTDLDMHGDEFAECPTTPDDDHVAGGRRPPPPGGGGGGGGGGPGPPPGGGGGLPQPGPAGQPPAQPQPPPGPGGQQGGADGGANANRAVAVPVNRAVAIPPGGGMAVANAPGGGRFPVAQPPGGPGGARPQLPAPPAQPQLQGPAPLQQLRGPAPLPRLQLQVQPALPAPAARRALLPPPRLNQQLQLPLQLALPRPQQQPALPPPRVPLALPQPQARLALPPPRAQLALPQPRAQLALPPPVPDNQLQLLPEPHGRQVVRAAAGPQRARHRQALTPPMDRTHLRRHHRLPARFGDQVMDRQLTYRRPPALPAPSGRPMLALPGPNGEDGTDMDHEQQGPLPLQGPEPLRALMPPESPTTPMVTSAPASPTASSSSAVYSRSSRSTRRHSEPSSQASSSPSAHSRSTQEGHRTRHEDPLVEQPASSRSSSQQPPSTRSSSPRQGSPSVSSRQSTSSQSEGHWDLFDEDRSVTYNSDLPLPGTTPPRRSAKRPHPTTDEDDDGSDTTITVDPRRHQSTDTEILYNTDTDTIEEQPEETQEGPEEEPQPSTSRQRDRDRSPLRSPSQTPMLPPRNAQRPFTTARNFTSTRHTTPLSPPLTPAATTAATGTSPIQSTSRTTDQHISERPNSPPHSTSSSD